MNRRNLSVAAMVCLLSLAGVWGAFAQEKGQDGQSAVTQPCIGEYGIGSEIEPFENFALGEA